MAGQHRDVHVCGCSACRSHPHSALAREHSAILRVFTTLDERARRLFAGLLAARQGHGGIQRLADITGLSRNTIRRGQREIADVNGAPPGRIRRPGAGRKRAEKKTPRS